MFVRNVTMRIEPDRATEFRQKIQNDILPMLRKQKGFQDELLLVRTDEGAVRAISFWDVKESADAYARETYTRVLEALDKLVLGTPEVETYEVAHSTLHSPVAGA